MTELAALNIRITGDAQGLKAAVGGVTQDLKRVGAAAQATQARAGGLTSAFGRLGAMSGSTRASIQQVALQAQDMAVQFAAGTRATTVFAQQGSQIASVFGPMGAIIGAIAAISLPLLGAAFATAGEKALTLEERIEALTEAAGEYSGAIDAVLLSQADLEERFGSFANQAREAFAALAAAEYADALEAMGATIEGLTTKFGSLHSIVTDTGETLAAGMNAIDLAGELDITAEAAVRVLNALRALDTAKGPTQVAEAAGRVRRELEAAGVTANNSLLTGVTQTEKAAIDMAAASERAERAAGNLATKMAQAYGAYANSRSMAAAMAAETERAAAAAASLSAYLGELSATGQSSGPDAVRSQQFGGGAFTPRVRGAGLPAPKAAGGGGGGGGGAVNPIIADLEAVKTALMTQEQAQIESFMRQQETLRSALEQRLLTQQEYQALMEQSQRQHSEAMAQIDAYRYGSALQQAETFLGSMATALSQGNDKMLRISRIFGAAEALISTYRGAAKALELPFPANLAAAAKVIAAGMGFVNAIKGGGKGGGGRGASASAANVNAAPAQAGTFINVALTGGDNFGGTQIRNLIAEINKAIENGAVIKGIRAT